MHVVCFSKSCGVYCKTIIGMQIKKRNKPVNAFNQRHFKVYHENHFQSNPTFIIISILKKNSHTFLYYLINIRGFEMKSRLPSSARNKQPYSPRPESMRHTVLHNKDCALTKNTAGTKSFYCDSGGWKLD